MSDVMTLLQCAKPLRLAKVCNGPDDFKPSSAPKYFDVRCMPIASIHDVFKILDTIQRKPRIAVIRGRQTDHGAELCNKRGMARRCNETFEDAPRHWFCLDVDRFTPETCDPIQDPVKAALEYLKRYISELLGVSFVLQLSSRMGFVPGLLKCHLWFWSDQPLTPKELKRFGLGINKAHPGAIDLALFSPIQIHYTANPIFVNGMRDPIAQRVMLIEGKRDFATLTIPAEKPPGGHLRLVSMNSDLMMLPDAERLAAALAWIDPDIYQTWTKTGLCLMALSGHLGEKTAFELWHAYSLRGRAGGEGTELKWTSFLPSMPADAAAGALLGMARDAVVEILEAERGKAALSERGREAALYLRANHPRAFEELRGKRYG